MIRAIIALLLSALPAWSQAPEIRAELLPGWRAEGGRHMAAIRLELPPGWITYWRDPGQAGIPPRMDISASRGVTDARIVWPAPKAFHSYGLRSLGYEGTVILPLALEVHGNARLDMLFGFGVCDEICVPVTARLTGDLPRPGAADPAIRVALSQVPQRHEGIARCALTRTAQGPAMEAVLTIPHLGRGETVALEAPGAHLGDPVLAREGGVLRATFPIRGGAVSRQGLHVTAVGPYGAVEQAGCPS